MTSPVNITTVDEDIQGQAQGGAREPHDGTVHVSEVTVTTDEFILDVTDPLAVQTDGGTSTDRANPLGEALSQGTPEDQLDALESA